jgi:hypothetical protein
MIRASAGRSLIFEDEIALRKTRRQVHLSRLLVLFVACVAVAAGAFNFYPASAQESLPAPPADRALIYFADERGALAPLAFEAGTTPLRIEAVAKGDKRSYVELKGASSPTAIANIEPRFYFFLPDEANVKPPFLVRLSEKRGARRVSAMAQKGYKGFAIDSEEIIKPHYRVLGREGGMQFVEFRPREPLMLGEYAIIGSDLQRIATFRITSASNP